MATQSTPLDHATRLHAARLYWQSARTSRAQHDSPTNRELEELALAAVDDALDAYLDEMDCD